MVGAPQQWLSYTDHYSHPSIPKAQTDPAINSYCPSNTYHNRVTSNAMINLFQSTVSLKQHQHITSLDLDIDPNDAQISKSASAHVTPAKDGQWPSV